MTGAKPRLDPLAAAEYAKRHPRPSGGPPHWVRCEWMLKGERCRKGKDHSGPHEFKEQAE